MENATNNATNTALNADDMEEEVRQKISSISMSSESLRSPKDNALYQKVEALVYEGIMVKDGRFVITVNKKDLKEKGLPEIYYDILKKDVDGINNNLLTQSFSKQVIEETFKAFSKSQEEYLARKAKESQQSK
jgi:hypothetical protein